MKCKVLCLLLAIKLVAPSKVQTGLGSSTLLPCVAPPLPANGSETDLALLVVTWLAAGSEVAWFRNGNGSVTDGFKWDSAYFLNGNFSLVVISARLAQQGVYECNVNYNSTNLMAANATLSILASPSLRLPLQWVAMETVSQLKCIAEGFYPPPVSFSWTREGQTIHPAQTAQAEQTPDGLYRSVGNLTFYPSQRDQNMTFSCQVTHACLTQTLEFYLNISYRPKVRLSAVPSAPRWSPITLYCDVEGFYPEQMTVQWIHNASVLPDTLDSKQGPDRMYSTRRYYTLSPKQREAGGEVACVVRQPGVSEPASSSALLEHLDPAESGPVLTKSAKASVALMCISLVLVILLCFGFSWQKRDEKQKSLDVSGIILPPRVMVGQKGRVSVSIQGRRVDRVQASWFLNDTPICDTSLTGKSLSRTNFNCLYNPLTIVHLPYGLTYSSSASEKGPLLSPSGELGYYKLHTQRPLQSLSKDSAQHLVSSVTFIPQISTHKGALFKCQVSYVGKDKVVVERVSEKITILAAPEVSEIQMKEMASDSDTISLTVQASRFHPDLITFRWFCQGGELTPVASQAQSSPQPDAQGFFSACSQCKLPCRELEQGGTKVWVSVHHAAMKQPVTRHTRGFIRHPCVSEIVASPWSPDRPLTLGCDITDFYPPAVTVTWLRRSWAEREHSHQEALEGGQLWGPLLSGKWLYCATATLHWPERETGGSVVCRVEHCSLDKPIDRVWTHTLVAVPSIPPSLSVCWMEDVGIFSLLLRGGTPGSALLWAAGSSILSPLSSNEKEEIGDDGQRELRSMCTLTRDGRPASQNGRPHNRQRNGHALSLEGIRFIDEKMNGEDDMVNRGEERISEEEEHLSDKGLREEREEGPGALGGEEVERLRVCVKITHPALVLPVYCTWTEPVEEREKLSCL